MIGIRAGMHIVLHFAAPAIAARLAYKEDFWRCWAVMMATMVVDLDHLLAVPVFDPNRCSIGFHPLHTTLAIGAYGLLALLPDSRLFRWIGIGLLIHMGLDGMDCIGQGS